MSRPSPAQFEAFPVSKLGSDRPVHEGGGGGSRGEEDLIANIHFLHQHLTPPIVMTHLRPDDAAEPFVEGTSTAYVTRALWRRKIFADLSQFSIAIQAAVNGGSHDAKVEFAMVSDSATYRVELTVPTGSGQWTEVTGTLSYDAAEAIDTIRMRVKNGTTGVLQLQSVHIRPKALVAVAAGKTAEGFVPHDTLEVSADDPLTTHTRQREIDNLEVLRKTRTATIVGHSEDIARASASSFETDSATYEQVAAIPFRAGPGETDLEWSLVGYVDPGGAGSVKLTTDHMEAASIAAVEQALGDTWTGPDYTAAAYDDGGSTLACVENAAGVLNVYLKGDGVDHAYLMSLTTWYEDAA